MTREEILKKAREQRSQSSGVASGAPVDPKTVDDIRKTARQQRGAGQPPAAPEQAPQESSAFGDALKRSAVGAMGPAGSILNILGLTDTAIGAGEAGLTMGTSMLAEPVAGIAGLGAAALGGAEAGANTVEAVRQGMAYQPKTAEGQASLEGIGGALAPIGNALTATSEFLGDTAYDITGSPAIATTFYTIPDAALEVLGAGVIGKSARASRVAKQTKEVEAATEVLQNPEMLVANPMGAQWKLDEAGVAVPNTTGRKLVDDGVASGADAALITNSNKTTKTQMEAMTQAFNRRSQSDPTGLSPNQVIGVNAAKALDEANKARRAVGAKIDEVVQGPAGKTPVNIKPVMSQFYDSLTELGIRPNVDMSTGKAYLDFRGSQLDFDTYKGAQRLLNDGFQMTNYKGVPTLADAHRMKKALDDLLDAKKLEQGGQLGNMERKLLDLRTGLNEAASQVEAYRSINAQYGALREGLSAFDSYRPAGTSWDSTNVANNVGSAMKSASADTANVNNMLQGLTNLNEAMRGAGAKPFSVDVAGLARYNDFLNGLWSNSVIASSPKTGMFRGAAKNAQGAAISAMVGNKFGVANNVAGLIQSGVDAKIAAQAAKRAQQQQALVLRALKN